MASSSSTASCYSFLNFRSPPPTSTRPPPQLIPRGRSDEVSSTSSLSIRRQLCAATIVVVVGLGGGHDPTFLAAKTVDATPDESTTVALVKPGQSQKDSPRWSDSIQGCPPWKSNSFQIVVPENLPRPSARRRWESVGNPAVDVASTTAAKSVDRNPGCFSM